MKPRSLCRCAPPRRGLPAVVVAAATSLAAGSGTRAAILQADVYVNLAAFGEVRDFNGTEVNSFSLFNPSGSWTNPDLSDDFFGVMGSVGMIHQGPTQTGVYSASIPSWFFPVLEAGEVGIKATFTDTTDGIFAIDYISIAILDDDNGPLEFHEYYYGGDDGFGVGLAPGAPLQAPLPVGLPYTGRGFDEPISSKSILTVLAVPSPAGACLGALALSAGAFRRRR